MAEIFFNSPWEGSIYQRSPINYASEGISIPHIFHSILI